MDWLIPIAALGWGGFALFGLAYGCTLHELGQVKGIAESDRELNTKLRRDLSASLDEAKETIDGLKAALREARGDVRPVQISKPFQDIGPDGYRPDGAEYG